MADATTLKCPSCGAPLPIEHRFVRMVACQYCQTVSEITDQGLDPTGKTARLAPLPTRFRVGQKGTLRGRREHHVERLGVVRNQVPPRGGPLQVTQSLVHKAQERAAARQA